MSRAPPNSIAMVGQPCILILSNAHVVFLKVSLFSGDHFIILGRHKATLKKVKLGAL